MIFSKYFWKILVFSWSPQNSDQKWYFRNIFWKILKILVGFWFSRNFGRKNVFLEILGKFGRKIFCAKFARNSDRKIFFQIFSSVPGPARCGVPAWEFSTRTAREDTRWSGPTHVWCVITGAMDPVTSNSKPDLDQKWESCVVLRDRYVDLEGASWTSTKVQH